MWATSTWTRIKQASAAVAFSLLAASCSDGRVGGTDGSGQGSGNGSPQADDDAQQTGDRDDSGSDDSSSSSDDDATGNGSGGSAASGGGAASDGNNSGESNGSGQSSSMGGSTSNGGSGSDTTNGDGTAASNRTDGTDGNSDTAPLVDCDTPGPRLIRRLTAKQFDNTLDALVGQGAPDEVVLSDPAVLGFTVDADAALVSDLTAEQLMNHAERVSAWVVENQPWEVSSCTSHDENCHRQFIEEFGRRAFRRDPTPEQMNTYLDMFAAEQSFEAGLYVVLATMLQSPYLLYRRELGEPDPGNSGQYILTPYEIATQLSYFLTDSPPDQQLLDAAAQNRLQSADEIDQQVYRLLSQPEAQEALANFVHGWLEVDGLFKKAKDPAVYDLTEPMRQAMLDQTRHFFFELFQSGGSIGDLFGADFTMVNQPLAELYGLGGVGGDAFSRVSLEGTQRATGVLGHAAFLSEHALPDNSSPVQRGVIVRERLLCQDLPPVPENLDTNLDEPSAFANNRERYAQHSADPNCAGCHTAIDPVGFAFEEYDAFGRYREQDMGSPVDASGELTGVDGGPIALNGLQSLNDYLSSSAEARSCLIRYWTYYAHGRDEWEQKECNHDAIRGEARAGNYSLQSTLFAIIHAPHFSRRVAD